MSIALLLSFLGCEEPVAVEGRVVDARTGAPLEMSLQVASAGVSARGMLRSDCAAELAKILRDGEGALRTDAAGQFSLAGGCTWELASAEPGVWLPSGPVVDGVDRAAWRVPEADGVYLSDAGGLTPLRTHTALEERHLWGSGAAVLLPLEIPDVLPRVGPGSELVVRGLALEVAPLLPAGAQVFDLGGAPQPVGPWFYVGARLGDAPPRGATPVEPARATLDPAAVVTTPAGAPEVRFIGAAALPAGRYALWVAGQQRAFIVDFGAAAP